MTTSLLAAGVLTTGCVAGSRSATRDRPADPHAQHDIPTRRFTDVERLAAGWDAPARDTWQRPEAVLDAIGLNVSDRVLDIGAGTGYFTVRFAARVPEGEVVAGDIEPALLKHIDKRAKTLGLHNVRTYAMATDTPAAPGRFDVVFMSNTYHHIAARTAYFQAAQDLLKPGGRVVIVDFKMGQIAHGPEERFRVPLTQLDRELRDAGYLPVLHDENTLPYQYIAVYGPASDRPAAPVDPRTQTPELPKVDPAP